MHARQQQMLAAAAAQSQTQRRADHAAELRAMLEIPTSSLAAWTDAEVEAEVDNNCQGMLG